MITEIEYNRRTYNVADNTDISCGNIPLKQHVLNGYKYVQYKGKLVPVHRLVAAAYCEIPEDQQLSDLQVDHIDADRLNNLISNLQWVTRKQNNSTEHSKKMRSLNWHSEDHSGQWLKVIDVKSGEESYYENLNTAAESLGVSRQAVLQYLKDRKRIDNKKAVWVSKNSIPKHWNELLLSQIEERDKIMKEISLKAKREKQVKDLLRKWSLHAVIETSSERIACYKCMYEALAVKTDLTFKKRKIRKLDEDEIEVWSRCKCIEEAVLKTSEYALKSFKCKFQQFMDSKKTTLQILDFLEEFKGKDCSL